jgi:DNA-binding MarR family transcriptional regulator
MSDQSNKPALSKKPGYYIIPILEEFRKIHPILQMQQAVVFLLIGDNPGIFMRELEVRSGLSPSAISRNVSMLGDRDWKGGEGLGLVKHYVDLNDRRAKYVKLTPKGKRTYDSLQLLLERLVE